MQEVAGIRTPASNLRLWPHVGSAIFRSNMEQPACLPDRLPEVTMSRNTRGKLVCESFGAVLVYGTGCRWGLGTLNSEICCGEQTMSPPTKN